MFLALKYDRQVKIHTNFPLTKMKCYENIAHKTFLALSHLHVPAVVLLWIICNYERIHIVANDVFSGNDMTID